LVVTGESLDFAASFVAVRGRTAQLSTDSPGGGPMLPPGAQDFFAKLSNIGLPLFLRLPRLCSLKPFSLSPEGF